jgi:DNA polymerase-3 subunit epsilon
MVNQYPLGSKERAQQFCEMEEQINFLWQKKRYGETGDLLKEAIKTIEAWPQNGFPLFIGNPFGTYKLLLHVYKSKEEYSDAIKLLNKTINKMESTHIYIDAWPYEELSKIFRKLKNYNAEEKILKRALDQKKYFTEKTIDRFLKRLVDVYSISKKYSEAIELCKILINNAESIQERGVIEAWPYEQLAKIMRKLKDYIGEIKVIERFFEHSLFPFQIEKLYKRFLRVYKLSGKLENREFGGNKVPYNLEKEVPIDSLDCFLAKGAIVDTETTGVLDEDEPIELAIILFNFNKRSGKIIKVLDEYSGLREPQACIDWRAKGLHSLTKIDLKGKQFHRERILKLFNEADMILAHNVGFDKKFITQLYPELSEKRWYCTMHGINWRKKGFSSAGLHSILGKHKIKIQQAHRALDDANGVLQLLSQYDKRTGKPYLFELLENTWNNILRLKRKDQYKKWAYG